MGRTPDIDLVSNRSGDLNREKLTNHFFFAKFLLAKAEAVVPQVIICNFSTLSASETCSQIAIAALPVQKNCINGHRLLNYGKNGSPNATTSRPCVTLTCHKSYCRLNTTQPYKLVIMLAMFVRE